MHCHCLSCNAIKATIIIRERIAFEIRDKYYIHTYIQSEDCLAVRSVQMYRINKKIDRLQHKKFTLSKSKIRPTSYVCSVSNDMNDNSNNIQLTVYKDSQNIQFDSERININPDKFSKAPLLDT